VGPFLEQHTGRSVELQVTSGSVENRRLLATGEVDLAMIQGDVLLDDGEATSVRLQIVAPLYPEAAHVICRERDTIDSITDLAGRRLYLGSADSGTRASAEKLLAHFHISAEEPVETGDAAGFADLLRDETVDAAIIISGTQNPSLTRVLSGGEFKLIAIPEADGLAVRSAHLRAFDLPMGMYSGAPPVPAETIRTVATTAFLAVRDDAPDGLLKAVLPAIYEHGLRAQFAVMIPRQQALSWCPVEPHGVARSYFDPVDRIDNIARMLESIAATKELLFTIGAGLFLLWQLRQRRKRRKKEQFVRREKDRLDALLAETLAIEAQHLEVSDPDLLRPMLDEVTRIKLRALHELTEEELLADQAFSIFLIQCANLINKIQLKIISVSDRAASSAGSGDGVG
jgi:TRAP transporter TAXI family solute receptor